MKDLVLLTKPGEGVAVVTLNRQDKKNALSIALRDAVTDLLMELASDAAVKVVILTGSGGSFSAGFDLSEFARGAEEPDLMNRIWESGDPYHQGLLEFPLPIIAAVDGVALGGGMDTAVLCDVRIASTTARIGHPEVIFGDVVYAPLQDLVGGSVARDLCFTGRILNAEEALRLHLVSEVVEPEELQQRALEIANTIARAPRDILIRTKAKALSRAAISFSTTLEL